MTLQTRILPAYWASYLINGDASSLELGEQETIDAWLQREQLPMPVSCEPVGFQWHNDATLTGGEVEAYTFLTATN